MPEFKFHYGHSFIGFSLPDSYEIHQILPAEIYPDQPESEIIRHAIDHPLNNLELQNLITSESKVAIVVNDKTRPVPNSLLLPPLLEKLHTFGVKKENIQFIIGMGTHIPMQLEEYSKVLPAEVIANYSIVAHNCDDESALVFKGVTSRETPVFVNRLFCEADVRIVVGNIEPHHFAGFSGGVKSASIGVCGRKTINANHALLLEKGSIVGNFDSNPLRQDIEEIGRLIQVNLALNVVMNVEKQILKCFWGDPQQVMQEGIQASRSVSMQKIPHRVDMVIASAGGYPKDINLYQAQKAMTHASLVLRPGGIILLAAACEEGIGSQTYEKFMENVHSIDETMTKFTKEGFSVGPHKAVQIARISQDHPILLVSEIPPEKVTSLLLKPVNSIESGLALARSVDNNIHSIAVLPFAVSTIPIVQDK
jgi:nickel-dependent lactate racemase